MITSERVRFTIAVEADVYEAFAGLASASGVSMSRCIGDWLRDTAEAAQMTTVRVNEVRMDHQEIHRLYFDSLTRQVQKSLSGETGNRWVSGPGGTRIPVPAGAPFVFPPRPVIRGGKSSEKEQTLKGPKGSRK